MSNTACTEWCANAGNAKARPRSNKKLVNLKCMGFPPRCQVRRINARPCSTKEALVGCPRVGPEPLFRLVISAPAGADFSALEQVFQRQLNNTRAHRRGADLPEIRRTGHGSWIAELRVIERIEKLRTELQ